MDNPEYITEDGVLFNRKKTRLISCPKSMNGNYVIPDGVKEIGDGAFSGCTGLKSITIPASITTVGISAFENCPFLESVVLPARLERIGNWAFSNCPELHSINIGQVRSVGEGIFENTSIQFPYDAKRIDNLGQLIEFAKKYSRGDGVPMNRLRALGLWRRVMKKLSPEEVGNISEFINRNGGDRKERECMWIAYSKMIVEQSSIAEWNEDGEIKWGFDGNNGMLVIKGNRPIEDYADGKKTCQKKNYGVAEAPWTKRYGNQIKSVVVCYGVSVIGNAAFSVCLSLRSVVIPDGVKAIGGYSFQCCIALPRIFIPESVESITFNPFCRCDQLKSIEIAEGNKNYRVVGGVVFDKRITRLVSFGACTRISYQIPSTVTIIDRSSLEFCDKLTSITLPDSLMIIGNAAFEECNITSIKIPGSVVSLDGNPFANCERLTEIDISENPNFVFDNGVLMNKKKTELIYCSPRVTGEYFVPSTVVSIHENAFVDAIGFRLWLFQIRLHPLAN